MICKELTPHIPQDNRFLIMSEIIEKRDSVAVGIRLFEEIHFQERHLVGGVTPLSFYKEAARRMAEKIKNPVFLFFARIMILYGII